MTKLRIEARLYADVAHDGQFRKYGHSHIPYTSHTRRAADRVESHPDSTDVMVAATELHDTIEDCDVTAEDLLLHFPKEVVVLVEELTNPSKGSTAPRAERKKMDRDHISEISDEAKLIKLSDRADNLRECSSDPETPSSFCRLYARESALLLDCLRGIDPVQEQEIEELIEELSLR